MQKTFLLSLCSFVTVLSIQSGIAAPITPGNLVIYRVGDGTAALGTTAASVWLDEYTAGGGLVQSILLPPAGGPGGLTAVGTATTEGIISRSFDGSALIFTGYQKAVGGANPAGDTYVTTPRVVGTITAAGVPDTSTTIINDNGVTTANTIRSATGLSGAPGSPLWISTSTRVSFDGAGVGAPSGTVQIDARNSRQVNLSTFAGGPTLIAANGSTTVAGKVQSYGVFPVGATAPTPLVTLPLADAVNGFAMFDLNASIPGDDTLYALDTVTSKLLKYNFDGVSWLAQGSLTTSALNLTGYYDGTSVNLFLTTGTTLFSEIDSSGYLAPITGSLVSLTTAGANTAFRGIGMLPVPEPSSFALVGMGLLGLRAVRRKR